MSNTATERTERGTDESEGGFVLLWMAIVLVLLVSIAAFAVDLVHAYEEAQHLQNAVDAAAHAGSLEIPNDLTGDDAIAAARDLLKKNGVEDGKNGYSEVTITPDPDNPNQMDVTFKKKFDTFFGRIIGFKTMTVKETAAAQYDPPIDMGSPANNLGDIPSGSDGVNPADSVCKDVGWGAATVTAPCVKPASNATQHLFLQIIGPDTNKSSGNPYTSNFCNVIAPAVDGCAGAPGANPEYTGTESFTVRNQDPSQSLVIAVYDAGFVGQSTKCVLDNPLNIVPGAARNLGPPYCAGDATQNGQTCPSSGHPALQCADGVFRSFETDYDVVDSDGNPVSCGLNGAPWKIPGMAANDLNPGANTGATPANVNGGTKPLSYFYQSLRTLCTIPPSGGTTTEEYFVHVSSPSGQGTNNFSILALNNPGVPPSDVLNVETKEKLPLLALKSDSTPTDFFVARVRPAARDRILKLRLFDFSDSTTNPLGSNGSIQFLTSPGGSGSFVGAGNTFSCSYIPPPADTGSPTTLSDCNIPYNSAQWNNQWVEIDLTIPGNDPKTNAGYHCETHSPTLQDCWIQMEIRPAAGETLRDATTWNATISGTPVRLVK